jgi:hypothetical protein
MSSSGIVCTSPQLLSRKYLQVALLFLLSSVGLAQDAAGIRPFSTSARDNPYEVIDLSNLNILVNVPIRSKRGSALPFNFSLTANFQLYKPPVGSPQVWSSPLWNNSGGFVGATDVGMAQNSWVGLLKTSTTRTCSNGQQTTQYSN